MSVHENLSCCTETNTASNPRYLKNAMNVMTSSIQRTHVSIEMDEVECSFRVWGELSHSVPSVEHQHVFPCCRDDGLQLVLINRHFAERSIKHLNFRAVPVDYL